MPTRLSDEFLSLYNRIKGSDWPETCEYEEDVLNLPKHILQEIIFDFLLTSKNDSQKNIAKVQKFSSGTLDKPFDNYYTHTDTNLSLSNKLRINDIDIFYEKSLDGGGMSFGRRYPHVIRDLYRDRVFKNCFEWCSGPGFIGFELLSSGICENLFLADIYKPALTAIDQTIGSLPDKYYNHVQSAQIQGIADLPKDWKFDLIVSNPPHWNPKTKTFITSISFSDRICLDYDWNIHAEFFKNITPHLNDGAVILLQEQSYASGPDMFAPMIEDAGLVINGCYFESSRNDFYYLEVLKK